MSRDCEKTDEMEMEQVEVLLMTPLTDKAYNDFQNSTKKDIELSQLKDTILKGWPQNINQVPTQIKKYFPIRDELTFCEGLILRGDKVVVPKEEIQRVIQAAHKGHPGVQATLNRAREFVYWSTLSNDVTEKIKRCKICQHTQRKPVKETVLMKPIPTLPFEIVSSDVFYYKRSQYLLLVDSYSGYYEIEEMKQTNASSMITQFKKWFATHGIPKEFHSDNAVYSSKEFNEFAKAWNFKLITSSPRFARSNGLAEKFVGIAKNLIKKCDIANEDLQMALLMARNTPRNNKIGTPASRLFGRNTRSPLTIIDKMLQPKPPTNVSDQLRKEREKQKHHADKGAKQSRSYSTGEKVMIYDTNDGLWYTGEIVEPVTERSYTIRRDDGAIMRRNTSYLKPSHVQGTIIKKREVAASPSSFQNIQEDTTISNNQHTTISNNQQTSTSTTEIPEDNNQTTESTFNNPDMSTANTPREEKKTRSGRTVKPVVKLDL